MSRLALISHHDDDDVAISVARHRLLSLGTNSDVRARGQRIGSLHSLYLQCHIRQRRVLLAKATRAEVFFFSYSLSNAHDPTRSAIERERMRMHTIIRIDGRNTALV